MRRYFDEYRGLRETIGHVERLRRCARRVRDVRALGRRRPALDARAGRAGGERARWTGALASCTTAGRKVFSALGSRARPAAGAACSARCRSRAAADGAAPERRAPAPTCRRPMPARGADARLRRRSRASLRDGPGAAARPGARAWPTRERLHIAFVDPAVPARQRRPQHRSSSSCSRLERMGHTCSIWLHDPFGQHAHEWPARRCAARSREYFAPARRRRSSRASTTGTAPTSWSPPAGRPSTPLLAAATACARAPTSSTTTSPSSSPRRPSDWAERDLPPGPLRHRRRARGCATSYATATARAAGAFELGVDHDVYRPRPVARRARHGRLLRARASRRGARCRSGCWRSHELHRRAARTCASCCSATASRSTTPFPYEHLGVADARSSSRGLYSEATVGRLPVADELLADPAGDAGLRAAVRRPRGRERESCSAPTGRSSSRRSTRSRSPTRSSGCSTTARSGSAARRRADVRRGRTPGTTRPTQVEPGCGTRCASASSQLAPQRRCDRPS